VIVVDRRFFLLLPRFVVLFLCATRPTTSDSPITFGVVLPFVFFSLSNQIMARTHVSLVPSCLEFALRVIVIEVLALHNTPFTRAAYSYSVSDKVWVSWMKLLDTSLAVDLRPIKIDMVWAALVPADRRVPSTADANIDHVHVLLDLDLPVVEALYVAVIVVLVLT
jgi:hypothetical protein